MLLLKRTTCCQKSGLLMLLLPCLMLLHQDLNSQGKFIYNQLFAFFCSCIFVFISCFLLTMRDDSIEGIYETLKQCAIISKSAGGIGLNIHCIRATGSYIAGTNGISNGIVPMLRVYNNTARYVDQGGNKVRLTRTKWK
jgi:hypothetical protein